MGADEVIAAATAELGKVDAVRGLFLAGSRGCGTDDDWSDVDFVAVGSDGAHSEIASHWQAMLDRQGSVVHRMERKQGPVLLLNAITAGWLRIDLSIVAPELFAFGRARDGLHALIDRDNLTALLPATLQPRMPDATKVRHLTTEFIRVMGLMPVVIGREEWTVAQAGTGLLRGFLQELLLEQVSNPDRGGALHLKRLLPADQIALLEALPVVPAERDAIIAAHVAIARAFVPCARALFATLGLEWPQVFEDATKRWIESRLGIAAADW